MIYPLLNIELRCEEDVVVTRQRARQVAGLLTYGDHEQTALATAASELARNAFAHTGGGVVGFHVRAAPDAALCIRISDKGPGISDLKAILDGQAERASIRSIGISSARRLVDEFDVQANGVAGTTILIAKRLPRRAPAVTAAWISSIAGELAARTLRSPLSEVQQQNLELLQALDQLQIRQAEVERLNAELAETNRGVLALYAELDEKADSLRRASELKTRFLSDITHELRTPLNAMISLSRLLLERVDGELNGEQDKQVGLIHRSASGLNEMVSDLLDIARIESGKSDLHSAPFDVSDVLAALRGMFRPLSPTKVKLTIEDPPVPVIMESDERKLAQILRNLISNALKFTEQGEVRVRTMAAGDGSISFSVSDTGLGIATADLERIFDDFTQIDSLIQRRVRGTGLGLPLTRKLARLLGGDVSVASAPGKGSTFVVTVPCALNAAELAQGGAGD